MKQIEGRLDDIEELFDGADHNCDDQVTLPEFRGLMLELDRRMDDAAITTSFQQIDTDGDGHINFVEFRTWWISN